MATAIAPTDIIAAPFDLLNPGTVHKTLEAADRTFVSDTRAAGQQAWQTFQQSNFVLNSLEIIGPDYHQFQVLIAGSSGTNGTYPGLINNSIAIECGAPIYNTVRCQMGNQTKEQNNLWYKSQMVDGFINQELGYSLTQAQADGFWILDSQGFKDLIPTGYSNTPTISNFYMSVPGGEFPIVSDLLVGTTGSTFNTTGYGYLTPMITYNTTGGNLPQWSVIQNRFFNPGFYSRMARTMADDPNDSTVFIRVPICRIFQSFRALPYIYGTQCSIQLTLVPNISQFLTTLPGSPTPTVTVYSSQLWYTVYRPIASVQLALKDFMNSGAKAIRSYKRMDCYRVPVPSSGTIALPSLSGEADWIFLYFQRQYRDLSFTCLKSYFEQYFPSNLNLVLGGNNLPNNPYITLNVTDSQRQYQDYILASGYATKGSAAQQLTYSQWVSYYPLYCFQVPKQEGLSTNNQTLSLTVTFPNTSSYTVPSDLTAVCTFLYGTQVQVLYSGGVESWGTPV